MPYRVTTQPTGSAHTGYHIYGADGYADTLRTRSGADHAVRMLNAGLCVIDAQRPVGQRVTPNPAPPTPNGDWREIMNFRLPARGTIGSL